MDNYQIADAFSLLSKLMDIHGENSFKAKSYASAAFAIEKLPMQLSEVPEEKIFSIKGIGDSTGKKVIELLTTGSLLQLNEMIEKTPAGILEMMNIKGIGPKKIATIWKEMEIETIGELLYACQENRLKLYKGFGEKTQQNVIDTIEYYLKGKGNYLYAQIEPLEAGIRSFFEKLFGDDKVVITGSYARQLEIIPSLEIIIDENVDAIEIKMQAVEEFLLQEKDATSLLYKAGAGLKIHLYGKDEKPFVAKVFYHSSSIEFATAFNERFPSIDYSSCKNDKDIFEQAGIQYIPTYQRENANIIDKAIANVLSNPIQATDIKGIIHSHSNWSDGTHTLEQMAEGAMAKGFEYLVISDHSKTAFYANGLSVEKLKEQHYQIEELNKKYAPFKIFKSIESDILNDGSLDYSDDILATFDLVIASIHSNLKMTEEKAMMRLLNAIGNPYTTILGHMTGRLLLSRRGYPVDHEKIIEACAANNVVIELNAHPSRLDIDWRHIEMALNKGVMISIDPDAHSTEGFSDIQFGVKVAQKAMLTKEQNLSSFSLNQMEAFVADRKKMKGI